MTSVKNCISIQQFLDLPKDTMFYHPDSDCEYTKEAVDLGFQDFQEYGSVIIRDYIETLEGYLKLFKIKTSGEIPI